MPNWFNPGGRHRKEGSPRTGDGRTESRRPRMNVEMRLPTGPLMPRQTANLHQQGWFRR